MKEARLGEHRYYASEECFELWHESWCPPKLIIQTFKKVPDFNELTRTTAKRLPVKGFKILNAHGGSNGQEWIYQDGNERVRVQDWIDAVDGSALVLMVACCNSDNFELVTKYSLLIHPSNDINLVFMLASSPSLRRYLPRVGYLD